MVGRLLRNTLGSDSPRLQLRFVTWNVFGLSLKGICDIVAQIDYDLQPDVLIFQEIGHRINSPHPMGKFSDDEFVFVVFLCPEGGKK